MPKVPITSTEPEHGEGNWSAKPGPRTPQASDAELQMLSYLRRIVDSLERISLAVVNISTYLASKEQQYQGPIPAADKPSSVSDS